MLQERREADSATAAAKRPATWANGAAARPGRKSPAARAALSSVLVVEGEAGLAAGLVLHLESVGHRVLVAGDGLHALYLLARQRPDLVVLDLEFPAVSGFRLLDVIRRDPTTADLPVLALTALSFQEAKARAASGVDDLLTRPVEPGAVAARAARLLGRGQRAQAGPDAA
jgi:DNA-binding response OmpR family regulator